MSRSLPSSAAVPARKRPVDPRLVRRSRAVRRHLALSVALGTLTAVAVVAQAWLVAKVVASGFAGSGRTEQIATAVVVLAAVFVARALVGWAHTVAAERAAVRVKSALRREVSRALLDPRAAGRRPASGRLIALLGPGLDALDGYFARYLPQLVLAVTVPFVVVAAVLLSDPLSAVIIVVTLPLIIVFMALVGWMTKERTDRRWRSLVRLTHHFVDVLDGLTVLKVFGRSRGQVRGIRDVGERHRTETLAALRLAFLSSFVLELVATIAVALVAVGIGLRILEDDLDLRTGLFVLLLAPEAYLPLRQVGTHFHDSAHGASAADDVFEILDGQHAVAGDRAPDLREVEIGLHRVGVQYPDRDRPALPPTDLVLRPGRVTALVGPSGCGKSTLLDVVLGFTPPTTGTVFVGDRDLADLDVASLRSQVAWVPQAPGLLAGTIGSNVRLGAPAASEEDVRRALDEAGAASLPTARPVREAGTDLSAGERRRVAVARALVRVRVGGAALVLLDEPTAGLDARAEAVVLRSLCDLGVTVLLVAHRDAAVQMADHVVAIGTGVAR